MQSVYKLPSPVPGLIGLERTVDPVQEDGIIRLNRNERLQPLPETFLLKVRASIQSGILTGYPATSDLRQELTEQLGIEQEQLLLTPGSDAAIKALYQAYVRPGDAVVMLDPSYAMYEVYARMFQAHRSSVPYDRTLFLDEADLLGRITPGVRLVLLANPNQPTGTLLSEEVLRDLIERAAQIGALVAVDEAYYPFSHTTIVSWVQQFPNLVVIRTFSKAAGLAGLRIGFVVGHPEVVANLARVRTAHDVNAMAVLCAHEILGAPAIIDDCVAQVEAGKELLVQRATGLGLVAPPTHTNFQLIRVGHVRPPSQLVEQLHRRGYLVKGPFAEPCLADCIRVTLGPPELMSHFADVLADVLGCQP